MLERKIGMFNQKYISTIAEKKKEDGLLGFFKKKLAIGDSKPLVKEEQESNISLEQLHLVDQAAAQNLFKLLDEQVDLSSKIKKKMKEEIEQLQQESKEFRQMYAKQMESVIEQTETLMSTNIHTCESTFNNFYEYGNHKSESEFKIVQSFKSDFEKMSIVDSFNDYIKTEIPMFNPQLVSEQYGSSNFDYIMMQRIEESL